MLGVLANGKELRGFLSREHIGQSVGHLHERHLQVVHVPIQAYGEEVPDGCAVLVHGFGCELALDDEVLEEMSGILLIQCVDGPARERDEAFEVARIVSECAS